MTNVSITRQIVPQLEQHLRKKEITLLLGPRQSGKTTILKILEKKLLKHGQKTLFLNLDIVADQEIVANQTDFIVYLKNLSAKYKVYVFIDEIQRIVNAGLFMKGVYDSNLHCKFILSGSSALEIKSKIVEPLTGRKKTFFLSTLTFDEFVGFNEPEIRNLKPIPKIYQETMLNLLDEYVRFGGYPRVVISKTEEEKISHLEEIYSSYLEKDIELYFDVRNKSSFLKMVSILAGEMGGVLNKDQLAGMIGSSRMTVDNFLSYLEGSFVLHTVQPFFKRPHKEIVKSPKIYFFDLGLRNMLIKNFTAFNIRPDKGVLLENFVLNCLLEKLSSVEKINYWRTKVGAEMDFVISRAGGVEKAVEVKAQKMKMPELTPSIRSFLEIYKPKEMLLVNLNLKQKPAIPFYDL